MSARRTRVDTSSASSGNRAKPADAVSGMLPAFTERTASSARWAAADPSDRLLTRTITANSSLESRKISEALGKVFLRTVAMRSRARSPASRPCMALTAANSSRSTMMSARRSPKRRASETSRARRWSNPRGFRALVAASVVISRRIRSDSSEASPVRPTMHTVAMIRPLK